MAGATHSNRPVLGKVLGVAVLEPVNWSVELRHRIDRTLIRVARLGFTITYKTAGTAKLRGSRTRHHMLWVGLWVG